MFDEIKGVDVEGLRGADESAIAGWCDDLSSAAADVRAAAAFKLAMLPQHPKRLSALLRRVVKKDRDELARSSAMLALGVSEHRLNSVRDVKLLDRLTGCDTESSRVPPPTVRLAAIIALGWIKRTEISLEMVRLLQANTAIQHPAAALPWHGGDLGGLIEIVLPIIEPIDVDDGLAEIKALVKAHPYTKGQGWPMEVEWPWDRFITRLFAPCGERPPEVPTWAELGEGQRRVLRYGFRKRLNLRPISRFGFDFTQPAWNWKRRPTWRRFLQIDDPGPLDREIECCHEGEKRRYPTWKWFRLLERDAVAADDLASALAATLPAPEIIELGRDITTLAYATYYEGDDDPSPRSCLVRDLIDGCGDLTADAQAVRFTLDKICGMEMWKMQDRGWKSGPWTRNPEEIT